MNSLDNAASPRYNVSLTSVTGGASATYAYNAMGQRVKKTAGGQTVYFLYVGGRLTAMLDGAGSDGLDKFAFALVCFWGAGIHPPL
jgi:hypothetical protein